MNYKTIDELKGRTITLIEHSEEEVVITCSDGTRWRMYHEQDCCEYVRVDKVFGVPENLYGALIVVAEEKVDSGEETCGESVTRTNFTLATEIAEVVFKWIGESNGYYSEGVYFIQLDA